MFCSLKVKMNLDQAIEHAEEVASNGCAGEECSLEHKQLADWLKELRQLRDILSPNPDDERPQRVVCSAIRSKETGLIICGARHHDSIMRAQVEACTMDRLEAKQAEQGFIDQYGKFLTRKEALVIAKEQEQIRYRCGGDTVQLYSDNLY